MSRGRRLVLAGRPGATREAAAGGDQAGPDEGLQVVGSLEGEQGQHGNHHADGQCDQENAEDESNDAQRRQGHIPWVLGSNEGAHSTRAGGAVNLLSPRSGALIDVSGPAFRRLVVDGIVVPPQPFPVGRAASILLSATVSNRKRQVRSR